jgi:hypothetical protein
MSNRTVRVMIKFPTHTDKIQGHGSSNYSTNANTSMTSTSLPNSMRRIGSRELQFKGVSMFHHNLPLIEEFEAQVLIGIKPGIRVWRVLPVSELVSSLARSRRRRILRVFSRHTFS